MYLQFSKFGTLEVNNKDFNFNRKINENDSITVIPKIGGVLTIPILNGTIENMTVAIISQKSGKKIIPANFQFSNVKSVIEVKLQSLALRYNDLYFLEIIKNGVYYYSEFFRVVKNENRILKIKTNNVSNVLSDGLNFINNNHEFYLYHYAYFDDLNFLHKENSNIYDNNRGKAQRITNFNYNFANIKILAPLHTARALGVLLSNDFVNFEFKNHEDKKVFLNIVKLSELGEQRATNGLIELTADYNYLEIPKASKILPPIKDVDFQVFFEGEATLDVNLPSSIFTLGYANLYFYDVENDLELYINIGKELEDTDFYFGFKNGKIPDNFLQGLNFDSPLKLYFIRDVAISDIGDGAFQNSNIAIMQDLFLEKIGKNVDINVDVDGGNLFFNPSKKWIFDNVKIHKPTASLNFDLTLKNYESLEILDFFPDGAVAKIENSNFSAYTFQKGKFKKTAVLENCKFTQNRISFSNTNITLINCEFDRDDLGTAEVNLEVFGGKIVNSFNTANLLVDTDNVIGFEVDNRSFKSVSEENNALNTILDGFGRNFSEPADPELLKGVVKIQIGDGGDGSISYLKNCFINKSSNLIIGTRINNEVTSLNMDECSLTFKDNFNFATSNFDGLFSQELDFAKAKNLIFQPNTFQDVEVNILSLTSEQLLMALQTANFFETKKMSNQAIHIINNLPTDFDFSILMQIPDNGSFQINLNYGYFFYIYDTFENSDESALFYFIQLKFPKQFYIYSQLI